MFRIEMPRTETTELLLTHLNRKQQKMFSLDLGNIPALIVSQLNSMINFYEIFTYPLRAVP